jgi:rod shape-determining protein MreC
MPLGTLDRTPPPFFKQGASAISKLLVFSALAVFLMVADLRLKVAQPLRQAISTVLQPVQWVAMQPLRAVQFVGGYLGGLHDALERMSTLERQLVEGVQRASRVEQLNQENAQLRQLLQLQQSPNTSGQAAEILYDAPDPFTRKVIIDKGLLHSIVPGSPVIGAAGVIGQVTRVNPTTSEVTLLIDRDQTTPVLNTRTGERSVAYGEASAHGTELEMRFMAANADVKQGDLLTTSGVDGVYPPGLQVARVERIERRADSAFAKIYCKPVAMMSGARHIMVLAPMTTTVAPPSDDKPAAPTRKPAKKGG